MKKLLIACVLIFIVGSVITDRLKNRKFSDADGQKLAAELNAKLPATSGSIRVDEVSYSAGVMHYTGTIIDGKVIDEPFKQAASQALRQMYCGNPAFKKTGVGVEYAFRSTGIRSLNDKVKLEEWSTAIGPRDC
jgi:hypothetical protein